MNGDKVTVPFVADALTAWLALVPGAAVPRNPEFQRSWDDVNCKATLELLTGGATGVDLARILAVSQPESGAWLHALPSPHMGTLLDGDSLRVAVALRLGCDNKFKYNRDIQQSYFPSMSVLPRGYECFRPCPRYGCVKGEYSIYYKRPRCGQPRPQPFQREATAYCSAPSNAPVERPCCYDFPCKAHCFNHGACTRPSGRYARTVWYPGECCPVVPPCQAFTCPNPPYHPCCYHTCNKLV
ncbi:unnamed protein product [Chilo suppressalis]|uniref:Uncharacterized protein n=1 Tax=Chilo suppressalis TaxID=168631 RepID=A0ABN8BFC1_CHISP|nr:unnamed protein product [Chilo suppressalis]